MRVPPRSIQQQERVSASEPTQTVANALVLCLAQRRKPKTSSTATRHKKPHQPKLMRSIYRISTLSLMMTRPLSLDIIRLPNTYPCYN